jgi:hypothetical protein
VAPCPVKEALLGLGLINILDGRSATDRPTPPWRVRFRRLNTEQGLLNSIERIVRVRCVLRV